MTLDHFAAHRACLERLPWLVNETLCGSERAAPTPPSRGYAPIRASYSLSRSRSGTVRTIAAAHDLREVDAWPIDLPGVYCAVFEIATDAALPATIERLRRDERVESAQPLQSFTALSASSALNSAHRYRELQRNLDVMQVEAAHRWSRGDGVRIGVIDTRVDAAHPDLAGRVIREQDLVGGGRSDGAAHRHGAAIEARLHIVNLSLAGPTDALLTRIVETGVKRGVVFVGATPASGSLQSFPTNIAGVLAANASGGPSIADATASAQLFAPGTDVLTLTPGGRYHFMSGSSLAAASISGGAALLLARNRTLSANEMRTLRARSMSTKDMKPVSVNLCSALAVLVEGVSCEERGTSRRSRR